MFSTTINGELSAVLPIKDLYTKSIFQIVKEISALLNSQTCVEAATQTTSQCISLRFFTSFNTTAKQETLRQAISSVTSRMDVNAGRDWVAVYVAYCFHTGCLKLIKRYADFFHDIDLLMPGLLANVKASNSNYDRYKSLSESLAGECKNWFICNGCLPPHTEWSSLQYRYCVADDRRRLVHELAASLSKAFCAA